MNVVIAVKKDSVLVSIGGSGMGKVIRHGESFHGVRYRVLRKMGDGAHWIRNDRYVKKHAN